MDPGQATVVERPTLGPARLAGTVLDWAERGLLPDRVIRAGIRQLCRQRLRELQAGDPAATAENEERLLRRMALAPVAPLPERANEQHYELPPAFFEEVLGPHRKYSCGYWASASDTLEQAEERALQISCERAGLRDGQSVLDLGCGWGSLALWIASRYPRSQVTAVSNSAAQRFTIAQQARERGLDNLTVLTADMNGFAAPGRYDRIVSVEMFEHMRNYQELFRRVAGWLQPEGRLFLHIFTHRCCSYEFHDHGPADWMGRHFFSGGMMPGADLPLRFQQDLRLLQRARWGGQHYQRTANAWLANLDARRAAVLPLLAATYGEAQAGRWLRRWRIFFMACAELFGLRGGSEWFVSHYLFARHDASSGKALAP